MHEAMQMLALLLAAAATPHSVAGVYQAQQMEVAAALELRKDGHFRYALSYGAVDEEAAGTWTFDGKTVRLTSVPMPKPPSFELVSDEPAPKGELYLKLEDPGFEWGHPLYAIGTDMKQAFELEADEDGKVDLAGKPPVLEIAPMIPVYGPAKDVFRLSPDRGHRLLFRFHRNDLGKAAFDREPLAFTAKGLVLNRYDAEIRFLRTRP
jgi:hypothetical protein